MSRALVCVLTILVSLIAAAAHAAQEELRAAVEIRDWETVERIIGEQRVATEQLVEALLADRLTLLEQAERDSAAALLRTVRQIALRYAAAYDDSLLWRMIIQQGALTDRTATAHRAWQAYRTAEAAYRNARPDEAHRALLEADSLAAVIGDRFLRSNAHNLIGSCHWMRGAFPEARTEYERALDFARQLGHRTREVGLLRNIAATYQYQQRGTEAVAALERVLTIAREIGYWEVYSQAVNDLGIIDLHGGELARARVRFEEALALARQHHLPSLAGNAELNLGLTLYQLGDLTAAQLRLEAALAASRALGNRRMEVGALLNLAGIAADLEQHSRRLALLHRALGIAEELTAADAVAQIRNELGETVRRLGHPEDALRFHSEALEAARRLGLTRTEAIALHNTGLSQADLGDYGAAAQAFQDEAALEEAHDNPIGRANAYIDLAWMCAQQEDYMRAEDWLRAAGAIEAARENLLLAANIEQALGIVLAAQGEREAAEEFFTNVLARAAHLPFPSLRWRAWVGQAKLRLAGGQPHAADTLLAAALDLIAATREQLRGAPTRMGFMEEKQEIVALRIRALTGGEPAQIATAFAVAEQAHAQVLRDVLVDPGPLLRQRVDSLDWAQHLALRRQLNDHQTALTVAAARRDWDAGTIDSLERKVAEARRAFRTHRAALSARYAPPGLRRLESRALGAEEIRRRVLLRDEVLIEFLVAERETEVFLLDRGDLAHHTICCSRDSLNTWVRTLRAYIQADTSTAVLVPLSRNLYDLLLAPLLENRPAVHRLLIVPDGVLGLLPFAALHDGTAYLAERYPLTLAPAASLLDPALAAFKRRGDRALLAVGNPASFRTGNLLASSQRGSQRWSFGELPYAEDEVRRIGAHFRRARILVGQGATEEAVKTAAPGVSHLHFATHGIAEEHEPLMSALVLAQDDDPLEDGLLQAHEIMTLPLTAELVVLSACNTGLGRVMGGEGILGLTHAFLCAGARGLLMSLWEVPDRTTADFMERFYAQLAAGEAPAEALRTARAQAIAAGRHVREWAAFELVQTGGRPARVTVLAYLTERPVWLSGLFLIGVIIVALIVRRRRR